MPSFVFKIFAVIAGIIIWKAFMRMIAGARAAQSTDEDDEEDSEFVEDEKKHPGKGPLPQARQSFFDEWQSAANELGCTFNPGEDPRGREASISGHFCGREILIRRFGRNYVRYFVQIRRSPGIQVCVVRDLDTIAERILNGHPIFPSRMFFPSSEPSFFCSAESEDEFDRFLSVPSNRSAVLNLVRLFPACTFNPNGVSVRLRATSPVVSVIDNMTAIASALESPSDTPMPDLRQPQTNKNDRVSPSVAESDDFVPQPEREDTPKRYAPLKVDVDSDPARLRRMKNAPAPSDRTSVLHLHDDPAEHSGSEKISASARTTVLRLDDVPAEAPAPKEKPAPPAAAVSPLFKAVETPRTVSSPGKAPVAPETPSNAAEPDSALSVESVCAVLFAKPFPGAEERAAFEAMKGRRVRWRGELLSSMTFSMDFVFGSRKGVKATLAVWKMNQSKYGAPVQIKAVAAFPPELRQELEAAKWQTLTFEGTLLKFEPYAHELYLQDATLVR